MKRVFTTLMFAAGLVLSSQGFATTYIVLPKDTLSEIAKRIISPNVYGIDGSLKKLLRLNLQIKNPDAIFPGQAILFEKETEEAVLEDNLSEEIVLDIEEDLQDPQQPAESDEDEDSEETAH